MNWLQTMNSRIFWSFASIAVCFNILASASPHQHEFRTRGTFMDRVERKELEKLGEYLKKNQPLIFTLPSTKIIDEDYSLNVEINDGLTWNAGNFEIDEIKNNLPRLQAQLKLKFIEPQLDGRFGIIGSIYNKDISGIGNFVVMMSNWEPSVVISVALRNQTIYISNVSVDYELESITILSSGLSIEGIAPDQINNFLENIVLKNKTEICSKISSQLLKQANYSLNGLTVKQFYNWLRRQL